jgi:hypothetical protein
VTDAEASLGRWAELLEVATDLPTDTPLLHRLREGAHAPVEGARALATLARISDWAELRRSSLVYFPVAFLALWDVHPLVPMERWRTRYGERVDRWLESVGELEFLVALALLRHDHPDWTLPSEGALPLDPEGPGADAPPPSIRARNLRHPLLPPHRAVGNDLELPGPGTLLLVTGSNMSGKSTLLRSLGTNQLLFLAGGPVAADAWSSPPLLPWTSMRVSDSLSEGVSFFMAELHRLRRVVDAARAAPVLILLDEILQGTNTAERRIAARIILEHLLAAGAVGAVSTHDLTLADAPSLAPHLMQVHLKEEVREVEGKRLLHFDYRLRPGPATSRNALLLLELVGLGEEGSGDASRRVDGLPPGGPTGSPDTLPGRGSEGQVPPPVTPPSLPLAPRPESSPARPSTCVPPHPPPLRLHGGLAPVLPGCGAAPEPEPEPEPHPQDAFMENLAACAAGLPGRGGARHLRRLRRRR